MIVKVYLCEYESRYGIIGFFRVRKYSSLFYEYSFIGVDFYE